MNTHCWSVRALNGMSSFPEIERNVSILNMKSVRRLNDAANVTL